VVKRYVESLDGRLELHPLPTYSPDLDSDDYFPAVMPIKIR
jgi:hypothetical protein